MKKIFITFFLVCVCFGLTANSYAQDVYISGKVTSLGNGVKGIEVNIDDQIYKTDENGYYKADGLQPGEDHLIKIEREDLSSSPAYIKTEKLDKNLDNADLIVYGEISGQVMYKGLPLKNATVKINDREQEYITDDKGCYKIFNVGLDKEYTVTVSSKNFSVNPKKTVLKAIVPEVKISTTTAVAFSNEKKQKDNKETEEDNLTEEKANILNFDADISKYSVTITVMKGVMPLENTEITVNNDKKNKYKTDKDGNCKIENLVCNRKYIIKAEKKGAVFTERIKTIEKLDKDEKLEFEALLDISGKVTIDNEPFANVIIECGGKKVKTDKNGSYIFKDMEPNKPYDIKAVSSIFDFYPKEISIKSLKNSVAENNFSLNTNVNIASNSPEKKEMLLQEKKIKIAAQKKEAAKIEKKEKARQRTIDAEIKKAQAEEDLKVKEEIAREQERIKETQLREENEIAAYKAALETEAAKEAAVTESAKDIVQKDTPKDIQTAEQQESKQEELLTIQGRVMKNNEGVGDVQIMLIMPPETKKYTTNKNGFYKIEGLEKNKNYVVTVLADTKTANLSPKSRIYKDLTKNLKNQNFYYMVDNKNEPAKKEEKK